MADVVHTATNCATAVAVQALVVLTADQETVAHYAQQLLCTAVLLDVHTSSLHVMHVEHRSLRQQRPRPVSVAVDQYRYSASLTHSKVVLSQAVAAVVAQRGLEALSSAVCQAHCASAALPAVAGSLLHRTARLRSQCVHLPVVLCMLVMCEAIQSAGLLSRCHWQCGQVSLFTNADGSRSCCTVYAAVLAQLVYQGYISSDARAVYQHTRRMGVLSSVDIREQYWLRSSQPLLTTCYIATAPLKVSGQGRNAVLN
eukprot:21204-Heterococcus_DN1.PRE.1